MVTNDAAYDISTSPMIASPFDQPCDLLGGYARTQRLEFRLYANPFRECVAEGLGAPDGPCRTVMRHTTHGEERGARIEERTCPELTSKARFQLPMLALIIVPLGMKMDQCVSQRDKVCKWLRWCRAKVELWTLREPKE